MLDKTKKELAKTFVLEDARFDPRSGVFITAWRDAAANKVALYVADTLNDPKTVVNELITIDVNVSRSDTPKYAIANRARIELQTKLDGNKTEYTQIYIFDQKTGLQSDAKFSTTFLSAKIYGSVKMMGANIELKPDNSFQVDPENFDGQIDPDTITTIYEHENELFFASKRLEDKYKNRLCLSKIEVGEFPYTYRVYAGGVGVVCAEETDGDFFGPSMNSNIVSFSNSQKTLSVYTLTDTEKDTPVFTKQSTFTLDNSVLKAGTAVRDIHTANNSYTIRLVSGKSIDDSGEGTYGLIRADGLNSEGYSPKDTVNFVINQIRLSVTLEKVSFYLLEQPFIFFEDEVLEFGVEKKVTITVTDKENKPAVVEASFTRYQTGSAIIQIVGESNFQDIEVDVNSTTKHNYDYSFVK